MQLDLNRAQVMPFLQLYRTRLVICASVCKELDCHQALIRKAVHTQHDIPSCLTEELQSLSAEMLLTVSMAQKGIWLLVQSTYNHYPD